MTRPTFDQWLAVRGLSDPWPADRRLLRGAYAGFLVALGPPGWLVFFLWFQTIQKRKSAHVRLWYAYIHQLEPGDVTFEPYVSPPAPPVPTRSRPPATGPISLPQILLFAGAVPSTALLVGLLFLATQPTAPVNTPHAETQLRCSSPANLSR